MNFVVKSIVSLDKLHVSGLDPELKTEPERHIVVQRFIEQFAKDPILACRYLVERSNPRVDAITLASLIFKTPELDKGQIGLLLASDGRLLEAFVDRFHFTRVRIDNALRMFLLSLRLPADRKISEVLLLGFLRGYMQANKKTIAYDINMGIELILSIMQLNDRLHGIYRFATATGQFAEDAFQTAWREHDPHGFVSKEVLSTIYWSIQDGPLPRALDSEAERIQAREVVVEPARFPPKLTYNVWSEDICISIPILDPNLSIRLLGEGFEFEPRVLNFSHKPNAIFRVRGLSIGLKSIMFERCGRNACVMLNIACLTIADVGSRALYASLGNARTVSVERAFMSHTLQVSFVSHKASKRKYCFSVNNAESRSRWDSFLRRQIQITSADKSKARIAKHQDIRVAAEAVALQVLRDAVIPPDEKTSDRPMQRTNRTGSVSVTYDAPAGRNEEESGPLASSTSKTGLPEGKLSGMVEVLTGKELVLLCRQNSLLPGLLELLQAGIGTRTTHEKVERPEEEKKLMAVENVKARVPGGRV